MTDQPCTWPACLSPDAQQALADEVTRQMSGEPPATPAPDQRNICGCSTPTGTETPTADRTSAIRDRIRTLTIPDPVDPYLAERLPGILDGSHRPTSLTLALIADATGVTVDWLLTGRPERVQHEKAGG